MLDKFSLLLALIFLTHIGWSQERSTFSQIYDSSFMASQQQMGLLDSVGNHRTLLLTSRLGEKELRRDKRSIVLIQKSEQLNDLPEPLVQKIRAAMDRGQNLRDYYIFANFVHSSLPDTDKTNHYIAVIPRNIRIEKLILQVEHFGSGLGVQTQLRFVLNQGFKMIPQESDSYPILTLDKGDLIFSLQTTAAIVVDKTWNPLKSLTGELANALQFASTEAMAKKQITSSVVESYEFVDWDSIQKKSVFERALSNSNREQENGIHNLVFNNGVTHTLLALKAGDNSIRTAHFNPYSMVEMLNSTMSTKLRPLPKLNEEFATLILKDEEVMSWDKIQKKKSYKKLAPLMDLVRLPSFEQVLREVTEFIIEQKMTYPSIQQVYSDGNRVGDRKTANLSQQKLAPALRKKVESAWKSRFPKRDPMEFFKVLETLNSQEN